VFWVISVYFNIRNTLPKSGTFFLGHPVYSINCGILGISTLFAKDRTVARGEGQVVALNPLKIWILQLGILWNIKDEHAEQN